MGQDRGLGPLSNVPSRVLEGLLKTLGPARLEHVVHGVHLEGAQRIAVVGRHEDHGDGRIDELEDLEAVQLRHLDVQEDDRGLLLRGRLHRLESGGALPDDTDLGIAREHLAQDVARRLLVVHDEHVDHSMLRAGIRTTTRKASAVFWASTRAPSP